MKIAIDGPAGAGKSTLARKLAGKLGFVYIDTGAMYRALTWKARQTGINLHNEALLFGLADSTDIYFESSADMQRVICDGLDITEAIRSPEVNTGVSLTAAHPLVRKIMVKKQQLMAQTNNVIMDGRDIGEVVLPDAQFKFFLTARLNERAARRALEMESQGHDVNENALKMDIDKRDRMDSERAVGSLKILADSIVIDTSECSADEVLERVLTIIGKG